MLSAVLHPPNTGVIGVMTVVTTVTRGAAHTHPAATISSPVRTGDASQSSLSVTRTTTVEMGQMSRSTYATPQNPRAPLTSSAVTMGTASTWGKSVTTWTTARTTVMRKDAVSPGWGMELCTFSTLSGSLRTFQYVFYAENLQTIYCGFHTWYTA